VNDLPLIRRVVARFKAPRTGFPPGIGEAVEKWTREAEKRGHDLGDWKLRAKSSPTYGWISKCVRCAAEFLVLYGKGGSGAIYQEAGVQFEVERPRVDPDEWDDNTCTVEPQDVVRGVHILMDNPEELLQQSEGAIADTLLKGIIDRGLGPHWTNPGNREVAENFAFGRKDRKGVPVILHAQFRREDQRRNYKPKGFQALSDFWYESEIHFGNSEILRLQYIEWHDGEKWVKHGLHDMKAKT
jgi:hypothetical protein